VLSSPAAHAALIVSAAWKVALAAFVWSYLRLSPADALALSPSAIARVAARDVLITWMVGGCWDWLHLAPSSPLSAYLAPFKFSGAPTRRGQLSHDAAWATVSALVSTAWEVIIVRAWANGALPPALAGDEWWTDVSTVTLLIALPYLQIVHFFIIHRLMHRWFVGRRAGGSALRIPDVGQWLYVHVHSLHHQSRDPTALSGISMHPVESALFFSTMPLIAMLGAHPIVMLHAKFYNIVVAMLGHESFGDPSTGGHEHWIHHQHIDCNFGGNFVPLDWLLGTHARNEEDFVAKFRQSKIE